MVVVRWLKTLARCDDVLVENNNPISGSLVDFGEENPRIELEEESNEEKGERVAIKNHDSHVKENTKN